MRSYEIINYFNTLAENLHNANVTGKIHISDLIVLCAMIINVIYCIWFRSSDFKFSIKDLLSCILVGSLLCILFIPILIMNVLESKEISLVFAYSLVYINVGIVFSNIIKIAKGVLFEWIRC